MSFNRYDKVRLLRETSGMPAGTIGTVMVEEANPALVWVQFESYGAHEVPEQNLEAVPDT